MLKLENLREGEVVEKVVRRHWIAFFLVAVYAVAGVLVIVWLYSIVWFLAWINILVIVFSMFLLLFLYVLWLNSELDMYVITNKRIIGIDEISFLNRQVSECSLKDVQEVNSLTKWVFANLLDFGSVTIQTAWNTSAFHMAIVPDPLKTARQILNIVDHSKKKPSFEN